MRVAWRAERSVTWNEQAGLLDVLLDPSGRAAYGVQSDDLRLAGVAPPADVYVASAVLAVLALLGALVGARAFASFALLYTRLAERDVDGHPRRAAILQALEKTSGLSVQELEEATGVTGGALRHHLDVLVRGGRLARLESGGFTRTGRRPPRRAPPTPARAARPIRRAAPAP